MISVFVLLFLVVVFCFGYLKRLPVPLFFAQLKLLVELCQNYIGHD